MLASDSTDVTTQLTGILNSTNGMTAWAQTLVNAVLPPMKPQPAWYQEIDTKIKVNQSIAQKWLDATAPSIISDMTTSFIEYNGHFKNVAKDMAPILINISKEGNSPDPMQLKELVELIQALQKEAKSNVLNVKSHLKQLDDFSGAMKQSFSELDDALNKAMPSEAKQLELVQQVQTQLQSAEITLAAANQAATDASVNSRTSMTSLVIGMTFALGFSPFSFGVALLALGSTVIVDIQTQARVISDLKQIEVLSKGLSNDQMQLGLIQGVISNLKRLESGIRSAQSSFDDFDNTWSFVSNGLSYLLITLNQPQIDISKIPDLNDLPAATTAWQTVHDFAVNTQSIEIKPSPAKNISANS
jgi:hypothetical protein